MQATNHRQGFSLVQLILSVMAVLAVTWGIYRFVENRELAENTKNNLRMIYMALEWYEMEQGRLPDLAFFPDDPRHDNDSILVALAKYGVTEEMTICPKAPAALKDLGLNFIWNAKLNGRKLFEPGAREWMLVEMHALSERVPLPNPNGYTILYTDGKVEQTRNPPPGIRLP
jgi:type II secretory pathway pseudopilin PulG